jgi:putative membrane protein
MTLSWMMAALHLLALPIGFAAVWARANALGARLHPATLGRVFRADAIWGLSAVLWIGTGLWRAFGGLEKGTEYYLGDHLFWAKMALLTLILLLELAPMTGLMRWRRRAARGEVVDTSAAVGYSRISRIQAALLLAMVVVATAMARGVTFP